MGIYIPVCPCMIIYADWNFNVNYISYNMGNMYHAGKAQQTTMLRRPFSLVSKCNETIWSTRTYIRNHSNMIICNYFIYSACMGVYQWKEGEFPFGEFPSLLASCPGFPPLHRSHPKDSVKWSLSTVDGNPLSKGCRIYTCPTNLSNDQPQGV